MKHLFAATLLLSVNVALAEDGVPRQIPECGIESYEYTSRPECGVELYREARSEYCGVELYNAKADMSCPGSHEQDQIAVSIATPCPSSYSLIAEIFPLNHCLRIKSIAVCRKPEFGVESYNNCRSPQHGVERYASCPDYTRPIYKTCSAKTRNELDAFITTAETQIDVSGALLLTHNANLFKLSNSPKALACFIQRWEGDPIAQSVVSDLKTQFPMLTGDEYSPTLTGICDAALNIREITNNCQLESTSPLCKTYKAFVANKTWLETTREKATAYLNEPAVLADANLAQSLNKISQQIADYLK